MIDLNERSLWFSAYLTEAIKCGASPNNAVAWAHSMALIAEQFTDNDGDELAECDY